MPEKELNFEDFINDVDPRYRGFVRETHEFMLDKGCKLKLALAKNGYVVSYPYGKSKHVIFNYVFRKKGLVARIYCDHIAQYTDFIETLPEKIIDSIKKAPSCKRFENPPKCNSKCGGYVFSIKGTQHQKCRYNCMMITIDDETTPFIKMLIEKELEYRSIE